MEPMGCISLSYSKAIHEEKTKNRVQMSEWPYKNYIDFDCALIWAYFHTAMIECQYDKLYRRGTRHYHRHRDEILAERHTDNFRTYARVRQKKYYWDHRERILAQQRRRYSAKHSKNPK